MDLRYNRKMAITCEEDQNMPPKILLRHKDYFEVKAIKKLKAQEEPSASPFMTKMRA